MRDLQEQMKKAQQEKEQQLEESQHTQNSAVEGVRKEYEERLAQIQGETERKLQEYSEVKQELDAMKEKEVSYAGKYEAISKTLIEARERADKVMADAEDESEIKIVRTKRFGMKPMYPEDACIQMELTDHDFFVFINAETDEVNVVYKRKGNTYGIIEPEY